MLGGVNIGMDGAYLTMGGVYPAMGKLFLVSNR
jgi:hypothetical protein